MDKVLMASTSSDECEAMQVSSQTDSLPDLRNQILQLLCTTLSDDSIEEMQEELQIMQRSSYYLEIQHDDLPPTADEQQHTLNLSDSTVRTLIGQQRLQSAQTLACGTVKILLKFLDMLYEDIIRGCRELEAFIVKYDQGSVNREVTGYMKQRIQQTQQYLNTFKERLTLNIGPLNLQRQLVIKEDNRSIQLHAYVVIKMPVIFNKFESYATSTTVHLCWEVAGEQCKDLDQQFEIHVKSINPTVAENKQLSITCRSNNIHVSDLIPDRHYEFSVKRVDAVNMMYGPWTDTIILKTLDISK